MIFAEVSLLEQECYTNCEFTIKNTILDLESIEYNASSFLLNEHKIIYRKSKETPKKLGQFVTFWKRSALGPIEPYNENDDLSNVSRVLMDLDPKSQNKIFEQIWNLDLLPLPLKGFPNLLK